MTFRKPRIYAQAAEVMPVTKTLRLTVTNKIVAGLGLILLIGMLSMLFIYRGLSIVDKVVDKLAAVEAPTSLAAYEMEINVNGMGLAVLKYLDNGEPRYRAWVEEDEADFRRFHREYVKLVNTSREHELGGLIDPVFREFNRLGKRLMRRRDAQAAVFTAAAENFEKIDNIVDQEILPKIDRQRPNALAKIEASMHMEAWIAEMALWTTNYQLVPKPEYRELIFVKEKRFRQSLSRFEGLDLRPENARWAAVVRGIANETAALVRAILAYEDNLLRGIDQFTALREELDRLLDDEIQLLALEDLTTPRQEADKATGQVLQTTGYLIPT